MKRIVITGAECTGKSTLAQALSGYYGEPWTPEFVRAYVEQVQREIEAVDLPEIFAGQLALEDAALENADRCIFHDTNLLSSILYANHYFGHRKDTEQTRFLERDYALYLLCSPRGIEWAADPGQRDSPQARDTLQGKFKAVLDQLALPYIELHGDLSARMSTAVRAVDGLLSC
ncbi:MAG: AAA family ATPase [Verrucomicrobia bacterium]|jgi:nicotinamide riboside kinase|nr:AAA family ATPase [Verrucomicrobiota bacterium]